MFHVNITYLICNNKKHWMNKIWIKYFVYLNLIMKIIYYLHNNTLDINKLIKNYIPNLFNTLISNYITYPNSQYSLYIAILIINVND